MAFIPEDGTGLDNSNSLATVVEFDAYCTDRGIDVSGFADDTSKEIALVKGADYLKTVYYGQWEGELLNSEQALPFPRVVSNETIFPTDIKYANIELALKANGGDLLSDTSQRVISEQVSSIKVTYSEYSDEATQYTKSYGYVKPYLSSDIGSFSHKIVRT